MGIAAEMEARMQTEAQQAPATESQTDASAVPADKSGNGHPDFAQQRTTQEPAKAHESAPSEAPEPHQVPYAAMKAEKERRRKFELENQKLMGELEALRRLQGGQSGTTAQQGKAETPQLTKAQLEAKLWEDPVAFQDWYYQQRRSAERQQEYQDRLSDDVADCREEYADYDQMEETFAKMVEENPDLGKRLVRQARPAQWAYRQAKKYLERQQSGSVKEKELAGRIAELEAKLKETEAAASAANVPQSNAGARGSGISSADNKGPGGVHDGLYSRHPRKSF